MLLEANDYQKIIDNEYSKVPDYEYIAYYVLDDKDYMNINDSSILADLKKKYIFIDIMHDDSGNYRTFGEFLNLIKNSSYVVTNSFHGTVFSLIFEKEFFSIPYKGTESRVLSLLKDLNLEDRIIIKNDKKIKFEAKIDYFKIKQELEKIKKETFNILDDLFGDCGWAE